MSEEQKMELALKAIDRIIDNLATSDFVTDHGRSAIASLKTYRVDMAADIVAVLFERS